MTTLALVGSAWMALALPAAVVLSRSVRIADQRTEQAHAATTVPDFIPEDVLASVASRQRRRG